MYRQGAWLLARRLFDADAAVLFWLWFFRVIVYTPSQSSWVLRCGDRPTPLADAILCSCAGGRAPAWCVGWVLGDVSFLVFVWWNGPTRSFDTDPKVPVPSFSFTCSVYIVYDGETLTPSFVANTGVPVAHPFFSLRMDAMHTQLLMAMKLLTDLEITLSHELGLHHTQLHGWSFCWWI